jgi:4,5-DOPA dioxygenase extradiol
MSSRTPVLFIGHGSPMNAVEDNDFTRTLKKLGGLLEKPKAILCVSAHWMTEGTWVTHMPKPKTIHDFYGFPEELFAIQYPAPGSPEVAELVKRTVPEVQLDDEMWGLDHGTWSVLRHLYPKADVPVLQLSLHMEKAPAYHYELGQKLRMLRAQGIMIVASGNIVHNLRRLRWGEQPEAYPWAIEFDEWVKEQILQKNHRALFEEFSLSEAGQLSVPTPEHYYPLLYALGASDENDQMKFEFEGIQNSSISMRTLSFSVR